MFWEQRERLFNTKIILCFDTRNKQFLIIQKTRSFSMFDEALVRQNTWNLNVSKSNLMTTCFDKCFVSFRPFTAKNGLTMSALNILAFPNQMAFASCLSFPLVLYWVKYFFKYLFQTNGSLSTLQHFFTVIFSFLLSLVLPIWNFLPSWHDSKLNIYFSPRWDANSKP